MKLPVEGKLRLQPGPTNSRYLASFITSLYKCNDDTSELFLVTDLVRQPGLPLQGPVPHHRDYPHQGDGHQERQRPRGKRRPKGGSQVQSLQNFQLPYRVHKAEDSFFTSAPFNQISWTDKCTTILRAPPSLGLTF